MEKACIGLGATIQNEEGRLVGALDVPFNSLHLGYQIWLRLWLCGMYILMYYKHLRLSKVEIEGDAFNVLISLKMVLLDLS